MDDGGLSPLARGNPPPAGVPLERMGPIPARAGHPRSRGATTPTSSTPRRPRGLSPLARGNHPGASPRAHSRGPIPARAGQPSTCRRSATTRRAYPRSRGATSFHVASDSAKPGLSPLARGNPPRWPARRGRGGPIPARAGQPRTRDGDDGDRRAYPRSRGATDSAADTATVQRGLSPLARGNLPEAAARQGRGGPIPARAGQPRASRPRAR